MGRNNASHSLFFFSLFLILAGLGIFLILTGGVEAVQPSGANTTAFSNQTAPTAPSGSAAAVAGNVTELNLNGYTVTQSWQGYYGNVTGTITLGNTLGNVFYNWSDVNPTGEVYASTNSSITWTNVQCFNFTATGTYANDNANRGKTSLYGTNLTQLENQYNINYTAADSVNKTFDILGNHTNFYTNNLDFSSNECRSTNLYTNQGAGGSTKFEEVLLYDPNTRSVIYTSLLNQNLLGFDNKTHDFEMIVPEDGHKTNTAPTTYYFYMEIQ